jgi:hypothetical protein
MKLTDENGGEIEHNRYRTYLQNEREAAFTIGFYYAHFSNGDPGKYKEALRTWRELDDPHAALKRAIEFINQWPIK